MDEPRDTNTNITRNELGIRISFEEHVTAIRILFHHIRTRIITFVPPPAKSSLVHPLPPFIVNYCQMASPREPTNGPTPISLSLSLSLSCNWSISPNSQSRFDRMVSPTNFQSDFQRDSSWAKFFKYISTPSSVIYIYSCSNEFTNSGYPREARNQKLGTTLDNDR